MKNRIFGAFVILVLLLNMILLPSFSKEENPARYHQHLEEPGYTPCNDHGDDVFCTHLPIVVIDTEGQTIPGEIVNGIQDYFYQDIFTKAEDGSDYINVSVSVIDNSEGNNHLTDQPDFTTRSLFRIRGNSSRWFDKKPYLLKFVDSTGADNDIEVMGMEAHNEWALHGPYVDKSLVRNYMWYNISGEMMEYAPNVRYCELFLNGDYRGLYLVVETIANGKNCRLNLAESYKGTEMAGYLLRIDRPTEVDLETTRDIYVFTERMGIEGADVAIRYPGKTKLTPEIARQIELDFSAFEKAVYSYDHDTEDYGYWHYIDVDNFIDYWIINAFTANQDAVSASTYFYKEPGGKFKMCVWDFNNACDNYIDDAHNAGLFISRGLLFTSAPYYAMLFRDNKEHFAEKVIERYQELREGLLGEEYMMTYIDETIEWLGPAVSRNYERWKDAFNQDMLDISDDGFDRNRYTTADAVQYLKEWLVARGEFMDEHIDVLNFFGHPSTYKKWEH